MKGDFSLIFVTFPSKEKALEVSKILLKEKLIACATLLSNCNSIYIWKGAVEEAEEILCIIKTKKEKYEKIEKLIRENHPYEVPEIIMVSVEEGFEEYLNWISSSII